MNKLIISLLSLCATLPLSAAVTLGDTPLTAIVTPEDAPSCSRLAASELQKYIEKTSGDKLPILNAAADATGNIFVGEQPDLCADLQPEGYRITARDGNLFITGRDQREPVSGIRNPWDFYEVYNQELGIGAFGEAGSLYGVYNFLEKYAGTRFYWPGEVGTVITSQDITVPADANDSNYPKFSYRYAWLCNFNVAPVESLWFRQLGLGSRSPVQIIDFNGFFTNAFKDTHPEYLALFNGERDSTDHCAIRGGGHLCLTTPGVTEAVAELICQYFRQHPEQHYFPLVPGDGLYHICECPDCQAQIEPEMGKIGDFSFHIWNFVNNVAAIVGKEFPDKNVGCLAYEHYLLPPKQIEKLNPNVAVMFCVNRGAMACPAYRDAMLERMSGWAARTDKALFVWDYYLHTWMPWNRLPVVFTHTAKEDILRMYKNGFGGEFIEAESWNNEFPNAIVNFPGTQHLNLYVTGKLYWDPELDIDALLDEYYNLFYGPAAAPLKHFFTLAEDCWNRSNAKCTVTSGIMESITPQDTFTVAELNTLSSCLEEGIALTPEGSPYRTRIELLQQEFAVGRQSLIAKVRSEKPEMLALNCADEIKIDGRLDEPTWQEGFGQAMVSKTGENTPFRTIVYARHDAQNLYFGFVLHEEKTDKLKVDGQVRDYPDMYLDDCLEIYMMKNDSDDGLQFIVNAAGQIWDALRHRDGVIDASWNCEGAVAAVQIEGQRITIELAIPLAEAGFKPDEKIAANFYRSRVVDEFQKFAAWSPTMADFHFIPERFGTLTLEAAE